MPVLDAPQYLQLHTALDTFSSLPVSVASQQLGSSVFWLDREVMSAALKSLLTDSQPADEDARRRRIREIAEEGWDIFLRVLADGSLVVQAVAVRNRKLPRPCMRSHLLHRISTGDRRHFSSNLPCCRQPQGYCRPVRAISMWCHTPTRDH